MMVSLLDKGHTTNDAYIDVAISMNNILDELLIGRCDIFFSICVPFKNTEERTDVNEQFQVKI